jgi:hypothetical protein
MAVLQVAQELKLRRESDGNELRLLFTSRPVDVISLAHLFAKRLCWGDRTWYTPQPPRPPLTNYKHPLDKNAAPRVLLCCLETACHHGLDASHPNCAVSAALSGSRS